VGCKRFPDWSLSAGIPKLYVTLLSAPFDPADYLKTPEAVATYLEAFFEDGVDRETLIHALGVVARARGGMSKLPKEPESRGRGFTKR
jgi:DNA-binding phage protein